MTLLRRPWGGSPVGDIFEHHSATLQRYYPVQVNSTKMVHAIYKRKFMGRHVNKTNGGDWLSEYTTPFEGHLPLNSWVASGYSIRVHTLDGALR